MQFCRKNKGVVINGAKRQWRPASHRLRGRVGRRMLAAAKNSEFKAPKFNDYPA
jgi:hypothetical protein